MQTAKRKHTRKRRKKRGSTLFRKSVIVFTTVDFGKANRPQLEAFHVRIPLYIAFPFQSRRDEMHWGAILGHHVCCESGKQYRCGLFNTLLPVYCRLLPSPPKTMEGPGFYGISVRKTWVFVKKRVDFIPCGDILKDCLSNCPANHLSDSRRSVVGGHPRLGYLPVSPVCE